MGKDAPAKAATEQQTIAQAQAAALAALDQAAKRTVRYGHARAGAYYHLKRANETLLKGRDFAGLKGQGQAFFWAKKSCPSDPSCLPSATHPRGNRSGADGIERSAALRRAEVPGGLKFWVSVCGRRA